MTAVAAPPGLLVELKRWAGIGALAGVLSSAAGWALMRAEAEYSPTCIFSTCHGADIPGPFPLLWMMLEVSSFYLLPVALVASVWEGVDALRTRVAPSRSSAATILAGPLALASSIAYRSMAFGQTGLIDGVWGPVHAIVVSTLGTMGASYLWVACVAGGVLMLWRREGSPIAAAALMGLALLSAAFDFWVVHFNDGWIP